MAKVKTLPASKVTTNFDIFRELFTETVKEIGLANGERLNALPSSSRTASYYIVVNNENMNKFLDKLKELEDLAYPINSKLFKFRLTSSQCQTVFEVVVSNC